MSKDILSTEQYEYVNTLVLFYQMETKWHIRQLLIQVNDFYIYSAMIEMIEIQ